jgi:hypothetical protein
MAAEKQNKAAVAFRDGLIWKVVTGFEDNEAGDRWLQFAGIDGFRALRDQKSGRPAQLEVVTLAEINKRKGLTQTWQDAEETRAAEIAAAEAEAKARAEAEAKAAAEAAREAVIQRLVNEQFKRECRSGRHDGVPLLKPNSQHASKTTRPNPSCRRSRRLPQGAPATTSGGRSADPKDPTWPRHAHDAMRPSRRL